MSAAASVPGPLDPLPAEPPDPHAGEGFRQRVAREAREELHRLVTDDTRIHEEIEELQARLGANREQRKQATGVLLALGLTAELSLPRSGDGGVSQLSDAAPPAADDAEPSPEAEAQPELDDDTITAAVTWVGTQENIAFNTGDLAKALDVERPVASGLMDTLVEREVIEPTDETNRYFKLRVVPPPPEPDEPDEAEPSAEPESAGDAAEAEAPAEPPKPRVRSSRQTGGKRANNQVVSLEEVRDAIREHFPEELFNAVMLSEKMGGVSPITLRTYIRELHAKGTLERTGGKGGPTVRYQYVKPDPRSGPRERPRHDGPRQIPKGTEHLTAIEGGQSKRGKAVAHTGRTVGRSGKPGRDKKKAELGFRVKAKGGK